MKAVILGHITLDKIEVGMEEIFSLGGPPLYMGLLLRRLGIEVSLVTKFGPDLRDERLLWIIRSGLRFEGNPLSNFPTTKFRITIRKGGRDLILLDRCEDIKDEIPKADLLLINPVAGEVEPQKRGKATFTYIDPQGFLRKFRDGKVELRPNRELLATPPDAIKVDLEELQALTGTRKPSEGIMELHRRGVKEVILNMGARGTALSLGGKTYFIPARRVEVFDGVGMGDLLGAGYSYGRMVGGPLYGLALGYAAATLYADRRALEKIPTKDELLLLAKRETERIIRVDLESLGK